MNSTVQGFPRYTDRNTDKKKKKKKKKKEETSVSMLLETAETTLMASSKFVIYQPETLTGH